MRWDVERELSKRHGLPRSSVFETLYRTDTWRDIERGIGDAAAWKAEAHAAPRGARGIARCPACMTSGSARSD